MSELESHMLAEEELSSIFSNRKHQSKTGIIRYTRPLPQSILSPTSHSTNPTKQPTEQLGKTDIGFSNFGHFKPPMKRPSCNPMIKDDRFRTLNELNNSAAFHPVKCSDRVISSNK